MVVMASQTKFHVLAVDDSNIDRKLIERLLKTSSYQGNKKISFIYSKMKKNKNKPIIYFFFKDIFYWH